VYRFPEDGRVLPKRVGVNKEAQWYTYTACAYVGFINEKNKKFIKPLVR